MQFIIIQIAVQCGVSVHTNMLFRVPRYIATALSAFVSLSSVLCPFIMLLIPWKSLGHTMVYRSAWLVERAHWGLTVYKHYHSSSKLYISSRSCMDLMISFYWLTSSCRELTFITSRSLAVRFRHTKDIINLPPDLSIRLLIEEHMTHVEVRYLLA
jgi:hypothetical protein